MAEIMTVRGPIAPHELGFTSMHEHILCDASVFLRRHGALIPPNAPVSLGDPIALDNLSILRHAFILSRDTMDMRDEEFMAAEVADFRATGRAGDGRDEHAGAPSRSRGAAAHLREDRRAHRRDDRPVLGRLVARRDSRSMGIEELAAFMRERDRGRHRRDRHQGRAHQGGDHGFLGSRGDSLQRSAAGAAQGRGARVRRDGAFAHRASSAGHEGGCPRGDPVDARGGDEPRAGR